MQIFGVRESLPLPVCDVLYLAEYLVPEDDLLGFRLSRVRHQLVEPLLSPFGQLFAGGRLRVLVLICLQLSAEL